MSEVELQDKCKKNRKRSKRRAIYCPIHGCYLHSVSPKHYLYTKSATQLQKKGIGRQNALMLVAAKTAIGLQDEWLEAFWCDQCEQTKWYQVKMHIHKFPTKEVRNYEVSIAPAESWQQATGVIDSEGNPSVGEFTRRQARMVGNKTKNDFQV